ncbi:uncharacterized protein LOC113518307 [Galleria mellonella]|uniref:Uncharacterized protein LOC113518307 n=1 Tax=Galleria mellonella TaxID=7137 RepID=A0A6J1X0K5_GALME|nr:uncharacterized protein LOC113518307 [Galleria mellonella]
MKMQHIKTLQEMLDSDDELPNNYHEIPEVPAYKMDGRFEPIKFPWLSRSKDKQSVKKWNGNTLYSNLNEDTVYKQTKGLKPGEKALVAKVVLSEEDLYCLKCVETVNSDETFLWLLNFLIYKDMQSNYKYYKTCLVDVYVCDSIENYTSKDNINKKFYFEFKIDNKQ